ncbi:MAG: Zeta toxin family protein, partial [Candidatus Omnitrophota bacterium]|nr:Zeta toxin family protein [Candidatus Omnitrophota bacterium]
PNSQLAIARIKERVSEGGHDVPSKDVRRRFTRSIVNLFKLYQPLLDSWMIFNNAGIVPVLIAKSQAGKLAILDEQLFDKIVKMENKE